MVGQPPDETNPGTIRVTMTDGTTVEVKDAYVREGTLYGSGLMAGHYWGKPVALPLKNIVKIEERYIDGVQTGLAVLGGLVVVGGIVVVVWYIDYVNNY